MDSFAIATTCPLCQKTEEIRVIPEDYVKWREGMYIQDAFPYLSADQREQLMTGTCGACWELFFTEEEPE